LPRPGRARRPWRTGLWIAVALLGWVALTVAAVVLCCLLPLGVVAASMHPDWEREGAKWQPLTWVSDHEVCWVTNDGRRRPERPPLHLVIRDVRTGLERDLHPSLLAKRSCPPGKMAYSAADGKLYMLDKGVFRTRLVCLDLETLEWTRTSLSRETGVGARLVVTSGKGRVFVHSWLNGGGGMVSSDDAERWEPVSPLPGEAAYVTHGGPLDPGLDGLYEDDDRFITYGPDHKLVRRSVGGGQVSQLKPVSLPEALNRQWLGAELVGPDALVVVPEGSGRPVRWHPSSGNIERSSPLAKQERRSGVYISPGGSALAYWGDEYWAEWRQGRRTGPKTERLTWPEDVDLGPPG
jgi:hypothetical protein